MNALNYIVPIISIFITYILGSITSKNSVKRQVQLLRYENFYIPFMNILLKDYNFAKNPSKSSSEFRSAYFDLIMKNTQYLGPDSALMIFEYHRAYRVLDQYDSSDINYPAIYSEYNDIFIPMTYAILLEGQELSKYLKYPQLPKTILEIYDFQMPKNLRKLIKLRGNL